MKYRNRFFLILGMISFLSGCANESDIVSDFCPDNTDKKVPGLCGCDKSDVDTDNDGTPDCLDGCPNDHAKIVPGVCGCGEDDTLDANHNLVPDCLDKNADQCPEDKDKTEPGICGCGVSDVDSDNDGVMDCFDPCHQDASKILAGVCGCNVEDSFENLGDDDGDGLVNCLDPCPENPDISCKTKDVDGDGFSDEEDACPFNPNVHESGSDCNYVKESDGTMTFEIWSAHDLERLREVLNDNLTEGNAGLPCENVGQRTCLDADKSTDYVECWMGDNALFGTLVARQCLDSEVCTRNGNVDTCAPKLCRKLDDIDTAHVPGDCCNSSFESYCSEDGASVVCLDGMVTAQACAAGCEIRDAKAFCKHCRGDVLMQGGAVGDCCDSENYLSTCQEGHRLFCEGGRVAVETCYNGCQQLMGEDGASLPATCMACGLDVSGDVSGACCDKSTYQITCASDKKSRLSCENGYVVQQNCHSGCSEIAQGNVWCDVREDVSYRLNVRLMKNIDLSDILSRRQFAKRCAASWEPLTLYKTHFDGQGYTIRFGNTGDGANVDDRCGMVEPLFGVVSDSRIESLRLDYDVEGAARAALAGIAVHSEFSGIEWRGTWNKTEPLMQETQGHRDSTDADGMAEAAVFVYKASHSMMENMSYSGAIYANGGFLGAVGYARSSYLSQVKALPDSIICKREPCTAGFYELDHAFVQDFEMDIPSVQTQSEWASIYTMHESSLSKANIHIGSLENLSTPMSNGVALLAHEAGNISELTLSVEKVVAPASSVIVTELMNRPSNHWQLNLGDVTTMKFGGIVMLGQKLSHLTFSMNALHLVSTSDSMASMIGMIGLVDDDGVLEHAKLQFNEVGPSDPLYNDAQCALGFYSIANRVSDIDLKIGKAECATLDVFAKILEKSAVERVNVDAGELWATGDLNIIANEIDSDGILNESTFYVDKAVGNVVSVMNIVNSALSVTDVAIGGGFYSYKAEESENRITNGFVTALRTSSMNMTRVVTSPKFYVSTGDQKNLESYQPTTVFPMVYGSIEPSPQLTIAGEHQYYLSRDGSEVVSKSDSILTQFGAYKPSEVGEVVESLGGKDAGWTTRSIGGETIPWRIFDTADE